MINVVDISSSRIIGDDTHLTFVSGDNKAYDATFSAPARAKLLALLQVEVAIRLEKDLIPLTVVGVSTGASATGFALVVETTEAGPIAFQIARDRRTAIRQALAELDSMPDPQQECELYYWAIPQPLCQCGCGR
jgi:hypothetical protein